MDQILQWFEANAGKIIFLLVAIVAALLITKGLARVMRKVLDRTDMPSASIFINIMRVLVWILAASIVLQPVFGISPTTLMTALGVGGIAVSLGLKDTVANVISGFGLMLGKVIQPAIWCRSRGRPAWSRTSRGGRRWCASATATRWSYPIPCSTPRRWRSSRRPMKDA